MIQRVSRARVLVEGSEQSAIPRGLLVLLGVSGTDGSSDASWMCGKISRLRIFPDEQGLMNLSVKDAGGEVLVVSQFTLLADARKGNRPSFTDAAEPVLAQRLYLEVVEGLRGEGLPVKTGVFGALMQVELNNDGPVTIILESDK